jgi:hypothetical protein
MPEWIHDRAHHIMQDSPGTAKSTAYAIATQQAHKTGHTPQGYGTAEGKREAKAKYDAPKSEYKQTADPSHKSKSASADVAFWMGFSDELAKIAMTLSPPKPSLNLPKPTSLVRNSPAPIQMKDPLSSTKTLTPPPVTVGA